MPATTTMPRALGDRAHARRPRPVERFGDRRQRHPEPAHRRLGEQHQPRARVGGAAGVVLDQPRLAAGSVPLWICARAIRMPLSLARRRVGDDGRPTARRARRRAAGGAAARRETRRRAAASEHRPPAHPRAEHAVARGAGPRPVGRGQQRVDRLARRRCGGSAPSAAARRDPTGFSIANGSHASVRLTGPPASSSTQQQRLPSSSQVPSTISPPGASGPHLRPRVGHRRRRGTGAAR